MPEEPEGTSCRAGPDETLGAQGDAPRLSGREIGRSRRRCTPHSEVFSSPGRPGRLERPEGPLDLGRGSSWSFGQAGPPGRVRGGRSHAGRARDCGCCRGAAPAEHARAHAVAARCHPRHQGHTRRLPVAGSRERQARGCPHVRRRAGSPLHGGDPAGARAPGAASDVLLSRQVGAAGRWPRPRDMRPRPRDRSPRLRAREARRALAALGETRRRTKRRPARGARRSAGLLSALLRPRDGCSGVSTRERSCCSTTATSVPHRERPTVPGGRSGRCPKRSPSGVSWR